MNIDQIENFFKSSARSAGARLYKEAKVSFSKPSAIEVTAYVKPNYRVSLKLDSIRSHKMLVDCNCPQSKKGEFCKHTWAAFLAVYEKAPDFFENTKEVVKKEAVVKTTPAQTESQIKAKAAFKIKQDTYRKEQYQKQKARAKEFKNSKKKSFVETPTFPKEVQSALDYFSQNGFSFEGSLNEDSVSFARKKLARIFHPDVGGSHAESVELNSNSQILLKYVNSMSRPS